MASITPINTATDTPSSAATKTNANELAINTELETNTTATALNTAKVTNATHTGDVTGATALSIGPKKVTLAMMEDGVEGELITYDSSGVAAKVATGTATQVLTSNGAGTAPTFQDAAGGGGGEYKAGTSTKNIADASGTQTISHGLSSVPLKVKLTANYMGGDQQYISIGQFCSSGNTSVASTANMLGQYASVVSSIFAISIGNYFSNNTGDVRGQTGIVTVDSTNITITWTKNQTGQTGTYPFMWEAEC